MSNVIARSSRAVLCSVLVVAGLVVASQEAATTAGAASSCELPYLGIEFGTAGPDAGHVNAYLVFTNRAATACTMDGFPTVHYIGAHGATIGNPSMPNGGTPRTVTLVTGESAHSLFRESVPGDWDPTKCKPTQASGLRVVPPGSSRSVVLRFPEKVCSGLRIHEAKTAPVSAGTGPTPGVCTSTQLVATLGQSQGAAGTIYVPLVFTNPVLYTCIVHGHPAVSSVTGSSNTQVGPPASKDPGAAADVWVQPFGGTASARLGIVETGNFTKSACVPHNASGLRVVAPESTHATILAYAHSVCTHLSSTHVSVVTAGSGSGARRSNKRHPSSSSDSSSCCSNARPTAPRSPCRRPSASRTCTSAISRRWEQTGTCGLRARSMRSGTSRSAGCACTAPDRRSAPASSPSRIPPWWPGASRSTSCTSTARRAHSEPPRRAGRRT